MYTLIGLYLLAPILSCWLKRTSKKELQFYLGLWGITLCYPLLESCLDIEQSATGILYYFTGYAGYFLLGYYMKNYSESIKFKYIIPGFCIAVAAPVVVKLLRWEVDFYRVFWYLSVFVVIMCIFWWKIFEKCTSKIHISEKLTRLIILLSNLSFGIYLSHIFIMRNILWHIESISSIGNYIIQTLIITLLTLLIAIGLSRMISLLAFGDYIIGYKQKSK